MVANDETIGAEWSQQQHVVEPNHVLEHRVGVPGRGRRRPIPATVHLGHHVAEPRAHP